MESYDLFGKPIEFNFDNRGSAHRTSIGGCFSLLIRGVLFAYFIIRAQLMLTNGANLNKTYPVTLKEFEPKSFGDMGMKVFLYMFDLGGAGDFIPYDENTKRYINITVEDQVYDMKNWIFGAT